MSDNHPSTPETGTGIDRRTVVRSAAWTVPVIAVSAQAPAFAASCNQQYGTVAGGLDFADPTQYTRTDKFNATAAVPLVSPGGTVGMTFAATRTVYTIDPLNLTVHAAPTGGLPQAGIEIRNQFETADTNTSANNQTLTITFSRRVYSLNFTLTDLDNSANHRDAVAIEGAPFTYDYLVGSQVQGVGSLSNPFRVTGTVNYDNSTDNSGNVRISMAGPVTQFSIRYWNTINAPTGPTGTQSIFLTRVNFSAFSNGCP